MDAQDAHRLYDIIEHEAIPLFYDRDADGIPRGWVRKIKASMRPVQRHPDAAGVHGAHVSGVTGRLRLS